MLLLTQYTLIFASVLLLVALGGCFSEHSGVINIGLEGIMVMGALGGALVMKYMVGTSPAVLVLCTLLGSILLGVVFSCLLAVASINFKADQTIIGVAMNMLGVAAATVIVKAINTAESPDNVSSTIQYIEQKKAFLVNIGGFEFNWFMVVALAALVIAYITLYPLRSAADRLRRASPGGGLRGHQCLQNALGRRAHFRRAGRPGRHLLHFGRRFRVEV